MKYYIGCSGFHYKDWKNKFYPEETPEREWLEYYSRYFNTVEINNTFYNTPSSKDLKRWAEQTPDNFRFTIKANRFFTHLKKLKMDDDCKKSLEDFQKTLHTLEKKLGCILWQFPRNLHKDISRIKCFSEALDPKFNHVFEFRHESWFDDEIYDLLDKNDITYCILSAPQGLSEEIHITSKIAYVRFHGKDKWYEYNYSDKELMEWKDRLSKLENIDEIYVYFNNDPNAWAVNNARMLKNLFGE